MSSIKATIRRQPRAPHVERILYERLGKETYLAFICTKEKYVCVSSFGDGDDGNGNHTTSITIKNGEYGRVWTDIEFRGRKYQEYNIIGHKWFKYGIRVILNRSSMLELPEPKQMDINLIKA